MPKEGVHESLRNGFVNMATKQEEVVAKERYRACHVEFASEKLSTLPLMALRTSAIH